MKGKRPPPSSILCVSGSLPQWVSAVVDDGQALLRSKVWFIYLGEDTKWDDFNGSQTVPWEDGTNQAVVIFYDRRPIASDVLLSWHRGIEGYALRAFRLLTRPPWIANEARLSDWLRAEMASLLHDPKVEPEPEGLRLGQYVQMRTGVTHSDTENEFLTLTFGPMQRAVESLESHRRRYAASVAVTESLRGKLHKALVSAYAMKPSKGDDPADEVMAKYGELLAEHRLGNVRPDSIPRILLTGETGVGKTLIARNFARAEREDALPYIRVSIPEFAGKEEDFESEMFGYRGGTYTGSSPDGSTGILVKHIGGVVFLDEIGDATPTMQAKLLAYLDDFKVRPRGFLTSLFVPTLIIAATNYDLDARVKAGDFRKDLLMRFPVQVKLPSLNERKDWLPLILDTLLQSEKVNPGRSITDIGQVALAHFTQRNYTDGNFRLLENTLAAAVERARRHGRSFLITEDILG